jgi:beta-glucosidase
VQLYTHQRTSRDKQPVKQLRAFQKVHLNPGRTTTVRLTLKAADLAHWDVTRNRWVVENSAYDVLLGSSAGDIRQRAVVRVHGDVIPARDLRKDTRAVDFDDYQGVDLVDESKTRGTAVGLSSGDWIKFSDAGLGSGARTFTVRASGEGTVQVRLGSPTGPVAGTATVPATGGKYVYTTATARLSGATGRRDVYLVGTGDLRLSTFTLR